MKLDRFIQKVEQFRRTMTFKQRALLSLLKRKDRWLARTAVRIPNVGSRFRDLRKLGFVVECITAKELSKKKRVHNSLLTNKQTFYKLDPSSVTKEKLLRVFTV